MKNREQKGPGYYMTKPRFPCIQELKPLLGAQDAAIQTNEIALRYFEESGNRSDIGMDRFLKKMADEYEVSHGENNFSYVKLKIAEANIINTFNIVDYFIKTFNKQYRVYKNVTSSRWIDRNKSGDQLDSLNQLYKNLPQSGKEVIEKTPEFFLLDYYRLVRNNLVHISTEGNSKVEDQHKEIMRKYGDHFNEFYNMTPNPIKNLQYEDYFLYTRAMKYFINKVNDAANLTYDEIIEEAYKNKTFIEKLRRTENIKEKNIRGKRIAYIKGYYRGNHGYGDIKLQAQDFFEYFKGKDKVNWD